MTESVTRGSDAAYFQITLDNFSNMIIIIIGRQWYNYYCYAKKRRPDPDVPHCDDGVQAWLDPFGVGREEIGFRRQKVSFHDARFHLCIDVIKLVLRVDVRHVASVQNVVYVFQKRLAFDLHHHHHHVRHHHVRLLRVVIRNRTYKTLKSLELVKVSSITYKLQQTVCCHMSN